jgi:hypothetical protein
MCAGCPLSLLSLLSLLQTVCGTLRFSSVEMKGICSVIPFSNCCEPATASSL